MGLFRILSLAARRKIMTAKTFKTKKGRSPYSYALQIL
tara:strand:- start:9 stop:122 length:114 start_codon:yes stop_codon:yes gene_type:complete